MVSPGQASFAAGVLRGIGAPVTPQNIAGFVGWAQAEGGWGHNNPLNTTQGAPGASNFNSVGVKRYPDAQTGIAATVQTLKNGRYGGILQAFHNNNPHALAGAIGASPWGTSGSLAAQTIAQMLGSPVPNVSRQGMRPPAMRPAGVTRTQVATQIGGGVDHQALNEAVFRALANRPISTTGHVSTANPLREYVAAEQSGKFDVPVTSSHDTLTSAQGPSGGTLTSDSLHHLTSNAGNLNPLGHGWSIGRTDQGVDANAAPGTPIHAINDSVVREVVPNWYAGQPLVLLQLTAGPDKGKYWYVSEQITHAAHVGQVVRRGDVVAQYAPTGTGIEIGWGSPHSAGRTLAQAEGNTGGPGHSNSPAGLDFARRVLGRG